MKISFALLALFGLAACNADISTGNDSSAESPFFAKGGDQAGPYTAVFDDALGNLLRSDNGTAYIDGRPDFETSCVGSSVFPGGIYQLRTIANTGACKAVQRPGWRWFTFDLGAANSLDLDQDGTAEPVESAPGRLIFQEAFAHGATSTPAKIYILQVNPDGSTTQEARWTVDYPAGAVVTPTPTGGRVLTAATGTADIYFNTLEGRKSVTTQMGTVQLPFNLTLTPQP